MKKIESELDAFVILKANLETQVNVLKASNIVFQNSNNKLLTQLNEANSKVINLTIGSEKLDKMLNIGKVYGDKSDLGFNGNDPSASSTSTKFIKATISVVSSFGLCHLLRKGLKGKPNPSPKENTMSLQAQIEQLLNEVTKLIAIPQAQTNKPRSSPVKIG
ncbi:unnamed protein product [Prunus armeniaca]